MVVPRQPVLIQSIAEDKIALNMSGRIVVTACLCLQRIKIPQTVGIV